MCEVDPRHGLAVGDHTDRLRNGALQLRYSVSRMTLVDKQVTCPDLNSDSEVVVIALWGKQRECGVALRARLFM